ncbi:MAG: selenide, water dikinase SelD [Flavobacteriales bacterium]|nr:selenide, water dikinase SelD [Flavobacteriales bacterium]
MSTEAIKLTQFSHGSGCGCKISPQVLAQILSSSEKAAEFPDLLVGNATKDDAAVYRISDDQAIISTTDFFMPIVDDAFQFGGIASANALSDVYAMGGKPLMAIAILGWPLDRIPTDVAQQVMEGARSICAKANIPLAGGHSIDSPEPIFGLSVTGSVNISNLKRNDNAQVGDSIYITKPLGVGILSAAQKRGKAVAKDHEMAVKQMLKLNTFGAVASVLNGVSAMTDVTGFGLMGHLIEVCEGSSVSAEINYSKVPLLENLKTYLDQFIYPDMTMKNFSSYSSKTSTLGGEQLFTLCDPQTSGGLLICVNPEAEIEFLALAKEENQPVWRIGLITDLKEKIVSVLNG